MPHTLLLRLAGPMQSWGTRSRFDHERETGMEPSKSGVIGLLCAALGRPREQAVDDLAALKLGVRVDRPGLLRRDYHTRRDVDLDGKPAKNSTITHRYYLADADFLAGLEHDDLEFLQSLDAALRAPRWQLCLGRKAFAPGLPVALPAPGVRVGMGLREALTSEPLIPGSGRLLNSPTPAAPLTLVLESAVGPGRQRRNDQPGPGAAFQTRSFLPRYVELTTVTVGDTNREIPRDDPAHREGAGS